MLHVVLVTLQFTISHIKIPFSHFNHLDKLLIARIVNTTKFSHNNITIYKG